MGGFPRNDIKDGDSPENMDWYETEIIHDTIPKPEDQGFGSRALYRKRYKTLSAKASAALMPVEARSIRYVLSLLLEHLSKISRISSLLIASLCRITALSILTLSLNLRGLISTSLYSRKFAAVMIKYLMCLDSLCLPLLQGRQQSQTKDRKNQSYCYCCRYSLTH